MRRYLLIALLAAGLAVACGDDPAENNGVTPDVGADADVEADADADAGPDVDARADADAGSDADAQLADEEQEPNDSLDDANRIAIGSDLTGIIEDRGGDDFDFDFYVLTLSPGERVRVQVTGEDQLEPYIFVGELLVFEGDNGQQEQSLFTVGEARGVEGQAAIEFTLSDDQEATDFVVAVTDVRNQPIDAADSPENLGGEAFGYNLTVSETTWTPTQQTLPLQTTGSLDRVGEYVWYEFDVGADSLLDVEITTSASDFTPFSAFLQDDGTAFVNRAHTALPVFEPLTLVAGVRDRFFRGGAGYDFEVSIREVSFAGLSFNDVAESGDNNAFENAQDLSGNIPASVSAEVTGDDETSFESDYFSVSLDQGETLGVFTGPGADDQSEDADTAIFVLDPNDLTLVFNDDYPLAGNFFSAGVITAEEAGEYVIVVEPFCNADGCFGGDYSLFAFIKPAN